MLVKSVDLTPGKSVLKILAKQAPRGVTIFGPKTRYSRRPRGRTPPHVQTRLQGGDLWKNSVVARWEPSGESQTSHILRGIKY